MVKIAPEVRIRINTQVKGEPAKILLELKQRGLVVSNTDAVIQGKGIAEGLGSREAGT